MEVGDSGLTGLNVPSHVEEAHMEEPEFVTAQHLYMEDLSAQPMAQGALIQKLTTPTLAQVSTNCMYM